MHRDIILHYPPDVEKLGYTPRTEVPALYMANRLISVQGHPEFDGAIVAAIAQSRYDMGLFDQQLYDDAMSRFCFEQAVNGLVLTFVKVEFIIHITAIMLDTFLSSSC